MIVQRRSVGCQITKGPPTRQNTLEEIFTAQVFHIRGNPSGGPLKGKSVCLKDCIVVAGVLQFFGTNAFAPWTPQRDAIVITRALDTGAEVVGTATCENFGNSTWSFTSAQRVVENPLAEGYSSGGSTSGGAALDKLDDRILGAPPRGSASFTESLRPTLSGATGFMVGILVEGFEHQLVGPPIKDLVMRAARRFETLGAIVEQVSVPCHMEGPAVWAIQQHIPGAFNLLGLQHGRRGLYPTEFEEARLPWTNASFQRLFPATMNTMINGLYLAKNFPGLYAKTLNLAQLLTDSYEKLFKTYDMVVMPTTPCVAPKHVDGRQGESPLKALKPSVGLSINTAIFNITGHPAMTIPIGSLPAKDNHAIQPPVGMQLLARRLCGKAQMPNTNEHRRVSPKNCRQFRRHSGYASGVCTVEGVMGPASQPLHTYSSPYPQTPSWNISKCNSYLNSQYLPVESVFCF
ncbi:amidase signature enzyme [Eremomyces bilateralis CBS 781.70]|uniref:Amidase signature enzyme n=1 Tax=Eremomyces bilateralis CBS 781.70 TaxID=1392243 RepID=A0A6G1GH21_9PEZI|nr:amidase signature enzyme [Eremomyces bilateralis CBS 781.70]KAF1817169.1 amidase signature enzyme [Eremomyces bilateralis CBS 781.70]